MSSAECSSGESRKQILTESFIPRLPFIRCCCLPPTSSLWGHIILLPQTFILQPSERCGLVLSSIPQINNVFSFADGGLSLDRTSSKSIPVQKTARRQIHLEVHKEFWGRLGQAVTVPWPQGLVQSNSALRRQVWRVILLSSLTPSHPGTPNQD